MQYLICTICTLQACNGSEPATCIDGTVGSPTRSYHRAAQDKPLHHALSCGVTVIKVCGANRLGLGLIKSSCIRCLGTCTVGEDGCRKRGKYEDRGTDSQSVMGQLSPSTIRSQSVDVDLTSRGPW